VTLESDRDLSRGDVQHRKLAGLEIGFGDSTPFLDSVRFNAAINMRSYFELRVERCNYLSKGLPEISCHVANEAMH
jgi:hypothetical protein